MDNQYIPLYLDIIILRYSCESICENCNIYLFSKDIVICGKCDKKYCYNCAKKIYFLKQNKCQHIPKCICCLCNDKDIENDNYNEFAMENTFSKSFEYNIKKI